MRIIKVPLNEINFIKTEYNQNLYESIIRIGFSFPIKVSLSDEGYVCIDGHKRLSVLSDILKEDPLYKRGNKVTVIIENSTNVRSNDCWRGRNTHWFIYIMY